MNFTKTTARQFVRECEQELRNDFERVDDIALHNQEKVLKAFQNNGIQARHMFGTTGYGYDDIGRDTLARVFAEVLGAESALIKNNENLNMQIQTMFMKLRNVSECK